MTPLALSGASSCCGRLAPPPEHSRCGVWPQTSCGPEHVIELGSNEAVKRAVEAGLGIGSLSTHTIEAERLAGLLVDLPLTGWECRRSFWLIRRRDRVLTRAEEAFLALLPRPAMVP